VSQQLPRAATRSSAGPRLTEEQILARIEDSFHAAKQPPVHPSKPLLKAVQVLPVLPNTECWENSYVTVCSVDTMLNILDFPGTTPQEREALLEGSLLRSYVMRAFLSKCLVQCVSRCSNAADVVHESTFQKTEITYQRIVGVQRNTLRGETHTCRRALFGPPFVRGSAQT
jgi:hypothetical protein